MIREVFSARGSLQLLCFLAMVLLSFSESRAAEPEPVVKDSSVETESDDRGWTFAGFPILNYTTERGFGYGLVGFAIDQGYEPLDGEPYRLSLGGQVYQTTGDYAFHKLLLDWRDIGGTGAQIKGFAGFESWPDSPYFGDGGTTRRFAEDDGAFQSYSDKSLWVVPQAFIPLDGGPWWILAGLTSRHVWLSTTGASALDLKPPRGVSGGLFLQWTLGGQYSTLDRSMNPESGYELEWTLRGGTPWLGSRWASVGTNAMYRHVVPLLGSGKLGFAWFLSADAQHGEPFFQSYWLGNSLRTPLGGHTFLRGYPMGRVRGNIKVAASGELRWSMFTHDVFSSPLEWFSATFTDAGWVANWNEVEELPLPFLSGGMGLRWLFNRVFMLRLDVALALERYIDPGEQHYTGVSHGVYFVVNLPF